MSDMITLPETEEGKIVYIVETMRDSIIRALDNNKRAIRQKETADKSSEYRDSKWNYEAHWNFSRCQYVYKGRYATMCYYPFATYNYEPGSFEYKLVEMLCNECRNEALSKESITSAVMATVLNEWKQKEENLRRRVERRSQHIKAYLDEIKAIAENCGVSVDTVARIKLQDTFHTVSDEF